MYQINYKDSPNGKVKSTTTSIAPQRIQKGRNNDYLLIVPFQRLETDEEKQNATTIKVSIDDVIKITGSFDADIAPKHLNIDSLTTITRLCSRQRNDLKVELRGSIGYRYNAEKGMYNLVDGKPTFFEKQTFSTDEGGTDYVLGFEASVLPKVISFGSAAQHSLHVGLHSGVMPVDGSVFIPVALHPRVTFNDATSPLLGNCNAWYLFSHVGFAIDASGTLPIIESDSKKFNSWFSDIGIGFDLGIAPSLDLSLDAGYRYTSFALPYDPMLKECLDNRNKNFDISQHRNAGQLFIRLGLTF